MCWQKNASHGGCAEPMTRIGLRQNVRWWRRQSVTENGKWRSGALWQAVMSSLRQPAIADGPDGNLAEHWLSRRRFAPVPSGQVTPEGGGKQGFHPCLLYPRAQRAPRKSPKGMPGDSGNATVDQGHWAAHFFSGNRMRLTALRHPARPQDQKAARPSSRSRQAPHHPCQRQSGVSKWLDGVSRSICCRTRQANASLYRHAPEMHYPADLAAFG